MSNYPDPVDSSTVLPGEDCPELPDLKPCPFCGSEEVATAGQYPYLWMFCESCYAGGPYETDAEDAITAWNRRVV